MLQYSARLWVAQALLLARYSPSLKTEPKDLPHVLRMIQRVNVPNAAGPDRLQVFRIGVLATELATATPDHEDAIVFHWADLDRVRTDLVPVRLTHGHATADPLFAFAVDGLHVTCQVLAAGKRPGTVRACKVFLRLLARGWHVPRIALSLFYFQRETVAIQLAIGVVRDERIRVWHIGTNHRCQSIGEQVVRHRICAKRFGLVERKLEAALVGGTGRETQMGWREALATRRVYFTRDITR